MSNSVTKLANLIRMRERFLLVGAPGCAKTARIEAAAASVGYRLVVIRASLADRTDFGGCLVPDMDNGVTKALPLDLLRDLQTTPDNVILLYDDLGQAPVDVQAAMMRTFDLGYLSPTVLICGATNRPTDGAGVKAPCEPLRSRFGLAFNIATGGDQEDRPDGGILLQSWNQEVADWCEWAVEHNAAPEIVAWHRSTQGRTLHTWRKHVDPSVRMPDFRTWETVMRLWAAGMRDSHTIAAAIGKPTTAEFLAFARLADQLPTPEQVWLDPMHALVPSDPAASFLVTSILAANAEPRFATALLQYLNRLDRVYGALLARDVKSKFEKAGTLSALATNREWILWFTQNQDLFSVGQ